MVKAQPPKEPKKKKQPNRAVAWFKSAWEWVCDVRLFIPPPHSVFWPILSLCAVGLVFFCLVKLHLERIHLCKVRCQSEKIELIRFSECMCRVAGGLVLPKIKDINN